jgi:dihydroorotase
MKLKDIQTLELPATADMHCHLRQAEMMELVTALIRQGGVDTVFVMVQHNPNTAFCL